MRRWGRWPVKLTCLARSESFVRSGVDPKVLDSLSNRMTAGPKPVAGRTPYYSTAARRAYLVVPEIGVLKWFLESSSIASVNLESECRF